MCDTWNHRICVFSPDFRYVNRRWYLTRWQQTQHKVKPNFLAINENNQCVVTCDDAPNYRGAVYVFDKMGYIQKIYDHESRNKSPNVEAKLNVPHGILLDDEGNWLTLCYSDSESCWVQRRSQHHDQTEEDELITYWKNKNLIGPSALAIKRDRTLIVGDRDDNSIYCYKQIQNN
jgi:6-phosphogluconolactonase (cycloisomerase 2 family)